MRRDEVRCTGPQTRAARRAQELAAGQCSQHDPFDQADDDEGGDDTPGDGEHGHQNLPAARAVAYGLSSATATVRPRCFAAESEAMTSRTSNARPECLAIGTIIVVDGDFDGMKLI
jgi:hypothetical protein